MRVEIGPELNGLGIKLGVCLVTGINNSVRHDEVRMYVRRAVDSVRSSMGLDALKDHPIIRAYRDCYWRVLGIDPTKQRPAQEALLRRVLRGEELPSINPAVDVGNAVSVMYMVPIGLYDVQRIGSEQLTLRRARRGEMFRPIGGEPRRLDEGQIVLAASNSKILHVFPYRDSVETAVTEATRDILIISAGVPGIDEGRLRDSAAEIARVYVELLSGNVSMGPTVV